MNLLNKHTIDQLLNQQDDLIEWLDNNLMHEDFENKHRELTLITTKLENNKMYHSPTDLKRLGKEFKLTK